MNKPAGDDTINDLLERCLSSECCNRKPQSGGLKQQALVSHRLEATSLRPGCQRGRALGESPASGLCPHVAFLCRRKEKEGEAGRPHLLL